MFESWLVCLLLVESDISKQIFDFFDARIEVTEKQIVPQVHNYFHSHHH